MATLNYRTTIQLTATAQNITLDVNDPYSLYELITSGNITIEGTTNITSTGTLIEGLTYSFKYTGVIDAGTLTIMGVTFPNQLKNKNCKVEAYYNGTSWEVSFIPDFNQTSIITLTNLTESNFGQYVIGGNPQSGTITVNASGLQELESLTIPANIPGIKGYRISAYGRFSSTASKKLVMKIVAGDSTFTLMDTEAITHNGTFRLISNVTLSGERDYRTNSVLIVGDGNIESYYEEGPDWDTSVAQELTFNAEETTPAGALVRIDSLVVEKINN
jgi:hypothetical protein